MDGSNRSEIKAASPPPSVTTSANLKASSRPLSSAHSSSRLDSTDVMARWQASGSDPEVKMDPKKSMRKEEQTYTWVSLLQKHADCKE